MSVSLRWPHMSVWTLFEMRRCKCAKLKWKLQLLRSSIPNGAQLKKLVKGHRANLQRDRTRGNIVTAEDVAQVFKETPNTTFVTISRRGTAVGDRCFFPSCCRSRPKPGWSFLKDQMTLKSKGLIPLYYEFLYP